MGLGELSLALLKIPSLSLRVEWVWVWMWNLYGYLKSEIAREEEMQGDEFGLIIKVGGKKVDIG